MPGSERAEIYFIVAMMVLTLIFSTVAVYFFIRQYKKEMREKAERTESAAQRKQESEIDPAG